MKEKTEMIENIVILLYYCQKCNSRAICTINIIKIILIEAYCKIIINLIKFIFDNNFTNKCQIPRKVTKSLNSKKK